MHTTGSWGRTTCETHIEQYLTHEYYLNISVCLQALSRGSSIGWLKPQGEEGDRQVHDLRAPEEMFIFINAFPFMFWKQPSAKERRGGTG